MTKKTKASPVIPPTGFDPFAVTGMDISLTNTGIVEFRKARPDPVSKSVKPKDSLHGLERLAWIEGRVLEAFQGIGGDERLVVIEGYAYKRQGAADTGIPEAGGVVKLALWRRGIPMLIVPPANLKLFTLGSGNASKSTMMQQVLYRWGFLAADDDLADAYALAKMGEAWLGRLDKVTEYQRRALDGVTEFIPGSAMGFGAGSASKIG